MTDQTQTIRRRIPGPTPPQQVQKSPAPAVNDHRPPPMSEMTVPAAAPALVNTMPQPVHAPRMISIGHLAKGIAGVMKEVGTIEKGGVNKFHGYRYARMEDLLVAITPLMGKHGIAVIQNEVERNIIETRCAVTYEFSILHESGEYWPERPRFTGMSIARDSKGNFDDKCINKAHTAARKYFLLSLFQVPSGDFDDTDQAPAPAPREKQRVPAPAPTAPTDTSKPHKIVLGKGAGPKQWMERYLDCARKSRSVDELRAWDKENDTSLQAISERHAVLYDEMMGTINQLMKTLEQADADGVVTDAVDDGPAGAMPDPTKDPQVAVNWVAQHLNDCKTYEAAEAFWNTIVAPREKDFFPPDFEVLLQEWRRTELRLGIVDTDQDDGAGNDPA